MHEDFQRTTTSFFHHLIFPVLLFLLRAVDAEIQTIKITTDSRPFILFQDFGFNHTGFISISISAISITTSAATIHSNSPKMGCFYAPLPARHTMERALMSDSCIMGRPFIFPIFTFSERILLSQSSINKTIPVTIPDLYYIFFLNCGVNTSISMTVNLETYNLDPNGDLDYIDDHFTSLPSTLFTFSFLNSVLLLIWFSMCFKYKSFLHKIHIFMGILLVLKVFDLLCHAEIQQNIRRRGIDTGWNVLWLVINFVYTLLFTNVIVLIGAGWSLLRPCLQEFHKYVMGVVISLQILVNICFVLMRHVGPSDKHYRYWSITYYTADFICRVTMLVPTFKSIDILSENSKTEGKEARNLAQLMLFKQFSLALQVYVYVTRLGIFVLRAATSYKLWCLTIALELTTDLVFYVLMFFMFRPNERNEYAVLGEKEEEQPDSATAHGTKIGF